jgi:hypothetical protein
MVPNFENELEKKIAKLLNKPIKIKFRGPQGIGNTWLNRLGIPMSSAAKPDWHGIEVKCLTFKDNNLKSGSDLTLCSKTPDWNELQKYGITQASFFHQVDYSYMYKGQSLFFTKRLRYNVSPDSRLIEWYIVPDDFPPTEPSSRAPTRTGTCIFSWKLDELLGKVKKLSVTLASMRGTYPKGTITPVRSYIIDLQSDQFLQLFLRGDIRYELRRTPKRRCKQIWIQAVRAARRRFFNHRSREFWEWADSEFIAKGGKWHDHGTGFRLKRSVLNSLLNLEEEILP